MSTDKPRLYLTLPPAFAPAELVPGLTEALDSGEVAALLMWLADERDAPWQEAAAALLPLAHSRGVPFLVGGSAERARRLGADGVHFEGPSEKLRAAVKAHTPKLMIGAGGIASRHEAMLAAESGVDYVFFGVADPAREAAIPTRTILELSKWSSEIFQIACVSAAGSLAEAEALEAAGGDIIALGEPVWTDPAGPAAAIEALVRCLQKTAVTT